MWNGHSIRKSQTWGTVSTPGRGGSLGLPGQGCVAGGGARKTAVGWRSAWREEQGQFRKCLDAEFRGLDLGSLRGCLWRSWSVCWAGCITPHSKRCGSAPPDTQGPCSESRCHLTSEGQLVTLRLQFPVRVMPGAGGWVLGWVLAPYCYQQGN